MSNTDHLENRDNLFKQYKKDCPETLGETDKAYDNDNFIDYLVKSTTLLQEQFEDLKRQNLEFQEQLALKDSDIQEMKILLQNASHYLETDNKELSETINEYLKIN